MHLGVWAVLARSFARIHKANLVNFGILPLLLVNPADYDKVREDDRIDLLGLADDIITTIFEGIVVPQKEPTINLKVNIEDNLKPKGGRT